MEALKHEIVHLRIGLARLALAAGHADLIPGNESGMDLGWDEVVAYANDERIGARAWQRMINKLALRLAANKGTHDLFIRMMENKHGRHR